jgi:hypothetical protein
MILAGLWITYNAGSGGSPNPFKGGPPPRI